MKEPTEAKSVAGESKRRRDWFRYVWAASYFTGIGIYLATTVVVCIWLGMKFDDFFGTEPNGRLAGIFLAFPAAIYSIYHKVREIFSEGKKK